jgi:hypothetical protein
MPGWFSAIAVIARRLTRTPMSEGDLLDFSDSLIANPPMPDDMRAALATRKYTDGRTLLEGWRSEMKTCVEQIAAEKTWALQRQRLIQLRVAAASWIALYRAVGIEPRISLWRGYVEGIGEFATNPESAWPTLLPKVYYFALLQTAILCPLGMGCYATDKALERHLELLTNLRQHAIKKGLVLDRGIQDIDDTDPELAASLMDARNETVLPQLRKLFGFLRELRDRIETGAVQETAIADRWAELCQEINQQVRALGIGEKLLA